MKYNKTRVLTLLLPFCLSLELKWPPALFEDGMGLTESSGILGSLPNLSSSRVEEVGGRGREEERGSPPPPPPGGPISTLVKKRT